MKKLIRRLWWILALLAAPMIAQPPVQKIPPVYTVGTLPACNAALNGQIRSVTNHDGTSTAPTAASPGVVAAFLCSGGSWVWLKPGSSITVSPIHANYVYAGPESGADDVAAFRALVADDIPADFVKQSGRDGGQRIFGASSSAGASLQCTSGTASLWSPNERAKFSASDTLFYAEARGPEPGGDVDPPLCYVSGAADQLDIVCQDGAGVGGKIHANAAGLTIDAPAIAFTDAGISGSDVDGAVAEATHAASADAAGDGLTSASSTAPLTLNLAAKAITGSVADASTSAKGVVQLATPSSDTTAGRVVQASDTRLSDARTPTAHAASHETGGGDALAHLAGSVIDTGTVAAARLGTMTGDSGAGGASGAAPAPAAGDAAAGKFLKADATWAAPAGGIGGSTGSVDKRILLASGTGGSTLQASSALSISNGILQFGGTTDSNAALINVSGSIWVVGAADPTDAFAPIKASSFSGDFNTPTNATAVATLNSTGLGAGSSWVIQWTSGANVSSGSVDTKIERGAAGVVKFTSAIQEKGLSAPPVACSAGAAGTEYYDADINKKCYCNGTNYVLSSDDTTTTGCS